MKKYTPTPWHTGNGGNMLVGSNGQVIGFTGHEGESNAAFIVKCCNAHNELVALLERAKTRLDDMLQSDLVRDIEKALAAAKGDA